MKSVLRAVLILFLVAMLVVSTEVAHGITFSTNAVSNVDASFRLADAPAAPSRVFLNQSFNNETTGAVPSNWIMLYPQYGNISVVNTTWYDASPAGKSAIIIDGYTESNPLPYRFFPEQTNTIVISFAIRPTSNIGTKKTIEIYVDDSNFNGACIVFQDGKIGYRLGYGGIFPLRDSYVPDRWYKIKMVLNIPLNIYRIYIDDHLEKTDAEFIGTCTQIHRIVFNETSGEDAKLLPVAYIDEILGVRGIEIPRDYSTIQQGIDAANEGDFVFVTRQRIYFESIMIREDKKGVWLCGEDVNTTIIDGGFPQTYWFEPSMANGISIQTSNVRISGLTIRSTPYGTGIRIEGSYNTIENCIVVNGLGDGIFLGAPNNTVTSSIIRVNLECGIEITDSNSTVIGNIIESNDKNGILINGWKSTVEDNIIRSNLGCGILISEGEQNLIRNNTIKKNEVGVNATAYARNNKIYQNRFINNTVQANNMDDTNKWDDDYPYSPDNETGGGNYWSAFSCVDIYSGKNQDEHADCCLPKPDGICDRPYVLSTVAQDNYPLFLIQSVTQNPDDPVKINYTTLVNVTAAVLKFVDVDRAQLEVEQDAIRSNISMTIANNTLKGTIPALKYGTQVRYNVTVHADSAEVGTHSINYPPKGPYNISDQEGPIIGNVTISPAAPDVNQTITVTTPVTEPQNASGVDKVFVSYLFQNTTWKAEMTLTANNSYSVVIPPQPWDGTLVITVTAMDKAGNPSSKSPSNVPVKKLPELTISYKNVVYQEPCNIDLGIMYRGEKRLDNNLRINNTGQEAMSWRIDLVKNGNWVKISPLNGTTVPGSANVTPISVDTTGLGADSYKASFLVIANGSVTSYVIEVYVTVRDTVIDQSYSSIEAPERSNVNESQHYGFHATWAHNGTDAVSGKIKVKEVGWLDVNATGWANFNDKSADPGQRTYYVEEVNFTDTKGGQVYLVRSFTQKASNRTTIWDRVKIVLEFLDDRIDINSPAVMLTNSSAYEFDNSPFNGAIYLNDTLVKNNVDKYYFTTSNIMDNKYGLTAFSSNTVACIWDRIKIIGEGRSKEQPPVSTTEKVWFIGIYEYDNALLKGANGTLFLNVYEYDAGTRSWRPVMSDEAMDWSAQNDRWEKSYSFSSQGTRRFNVSRVEDRLHNLTTIKDLVGPLDITWLSSGWSLWRNTSDNSSRNSQPVPAQDSLGMPLWAIASIAVTLAIGMSLIILILVRSGKPQIRKRAHNHTEGRYEE